MSVKLQTEHNLEFLSLKGGCTGSSESHLSKCHIVGNHISWLNIMSIDNSAKLETLQIGDPRKGRDVWMDKLITKALARQFCSLIYILLVRPTS